MNVELEDRVVKFTARCIKVCAALPDRRIGSTSLADQVFRSATSVAANYAEAEEAESRKDFIHKLKIAMKELPKRACGLRSLWKAGMSRNVSWRLS